MNSHEPQHNCESPRSWMRLGDADLALVTAELPRPLGAPVLAAWECLSCGMLRLRRRHGAVKMDAFFRSRSELKMGTPAFVQPVKPSPTGVVEFRIG